MLGVVVSVGEETIEEDLPGVVVSLGEETVEGERLEENAFGVVVNVREETVEGVALGLQLVLILGREIRISRLWG